MVTTPRKKKARSAECEQRRWPRLKPSSVPFLKSVSFNQGNEVRVIDISRGGMLLETEVRLRPQMKIHLKLSTSDGLIKLDGCVLRSSICSLDGVPKYQSAIAFDHPFHMLDDLSEQPAEAQADAQPEADALPMRPQEGALPPSPPIMGKYDEESAEMTFMALDVPGSTLIEMFKKNDW